MKVRDASNIVTAIQRMNFHLIIMTSKFLDTVVMQQMRYMYVLEVNFSKELLLF